MKYDVVIVGSGAGGAAAAFQAVSQGYKTLVLESGPYYQLSDYKLHESSWELRNFPEKESTQNVHEFGVMQELPEKYSHLRSWNAVHGKARRRGLGKKHRKAWKLHHVRGVGGSTLHFTGESHRLNEKSFSMYSDYKVAADWPLSYGDLDSFYEQAEDIVGVAGPDTQSFRPRNKSFPLAAHKQSFASQHLGDVFKKADLNWESNSLAVLSRPYDSRPACNYCGQCNRGCPRGDKGSVDQTFIKKALATNKLTIITGATAFNVVQGEGDRITGIEYYDERKQVKIAQGKQYVLSCGVVETPRLLLISKSKYSPNGLCNDTGHVGRHFMETIHWGSSGLVARQLGSHRGLPGDSICWDYNSPDAIPEVIGGCRFTMGVAEAGLAGPIGYATRILPGWGKAHKKSMRESFGKVITISGMGEHLPNDKSFVSLHSHIKDKFGLPKIKINSYLTDVDFKRLDFMAKKSRELLKLAGSEEVLEEYSSFDTFNSTHVFGTCRAGKAYNNSVVDGLGKSHRWKNLSILDASIFPSSGGGESPSLTIQAFALRSIKALEIV